MPTLTRVAALLVLLACSKPAQSPTRDAQPNQKTAADNSTVMVDSVLIVVNVLRSPQRDSIRFRTTFKNLRKKKIPFNLADNYPVLIEVSDATGKKIWTNLDGSAIQDLLEWGGKLGAGAERVVDVVWPLDSAIRTVHSTGVHFTAVIGADIGRSDIQLGPIPLDFGGL